MENRNDNTGVVRRTVSLTPAADNKLTRLMTATGMDRSTAVNLLVMRANLSAVLSEPRRRRRRARVGKAGKNEAEPGA